MVLFSISENSTLQLLLMLLEQKVPYGHYENSELVRITLHSRKHNEFVDHILSYQPLILIQKGVIVRRFSMCGGVLWKVFKFEEPTSDKPNWP